MTRTTTLFIVLTLAGTTAATTLCIGKCGVKTASIGTAATCHHRLTREGRPGILASEHGCDTLLQGVPFVREDVQRIAQGSASDHAVVTTPARNAALAPLEIGGGVPQPRHATSSRAPDLPVLRI